jgi:phosphosulfolactate phosphohydrolase-like enzyme
VIVLANGASRIVMVRSVEEALRRREAGIGQICMGEVQGRARRHQPPVSPVRGEAPGGFDFWKSPFELSTVDSSASATGDAVRPNQEDFQYTQEILRKVPQGAGYQPAAPTV